MNPIYVTAITVAVALILAVVLVDYAMHSVKRKRSK